MILVSRMFQLAWSAISRLKLNWSTGKGFLISFPQSQKRRQYFPLWKNGWGMSSPVAVAMGDEARVNAWGAARLIRRIRPTGTAAGRGRPGSKQPGSCFPVVSCFPAYDLRLGPKIVKNPVNPVKTGLYSAKYAKGGLFQFSSTQFGSVPGSANSSPLQSRGAASRASWDRMASDRVASPRDWYAANRVSVMTSK